jgi:hypothetical protein
MSGDRTHDLATCALPICVETRRLLAKRAIVARRAQRPAGAASAGPRVLPYPAGRSRDVGALGPLTGVCDEEPA